MKVLVTGGTGLVGSHVARQLISAGREVKLLVRNREKAELYYASINTTLPELAVGDITDASLVHRALHNCDALVHAAAGTPLGNTSTADLFAVNVGGVKNVVGEAVQRGLESIVHISSITAVFNPDPSKVTTDAQPTPSSMPYGKSKVEAELYVRKLQSQGAPISIVYPGAIIGPDDPGLSDTFKALQHRINNGFRIIDDGGMQHIDVRDLAAFITALITGDGHGRYLLPGVYCSWTELANIIERVSGCRIQRIPARGWKLRMAGRIMDLMRHFKTVDGPVSAETMRYATLWPNIKNTDELAKRGLHLRTPDNTFKDSLIWMLEHGHLQQAQVPDLSAGNISHARD